MEEGNTPSPTVDLTTNDDDQETKEDEPKSNSKFQKRSVHYLRIGKDTVMQLVLLLHDHHHFTDFLFQELMSMLRELIPLYMGSIETDGTFLSIKFLDTTPPELYRGDNLHFAYRFLPSQPRYSVMIRAKEEQKLRKETLELYLAKQSQSQSQNSADESHAQGEDPTPETPLTPSPKNSTDDIEFVTEQQRVYDSSLYYGFQIAKFCLMVETKEPSTSLQDTKLSILNKRNAPTQKISDFFAPASGQSSKAKKPKGDKSEEEGATKPKSKATSKTKTKGKPKIAHRKKFSHLENDGSKSDPNHVV